MKEFFKGLKNKVTEKAVNAKVVLQKKSEGLDGLIVVIGLILVAVVVLVLFKDKIMNSFNDQISTMDTKLNALGN